MFIPATAGFLTRKSKGLVTYNILDTSKSLSVSMYFSNSSSSTATGISQANEGTTVYLHIVFSEYVNTNLYFEYKGSSVSILDSGAPGSLDLYDNGPQYYRVSGTRAVIPYRILTDGRTEGTEYLRIQVYDGGIHGTQYGNFNLAIMDTSTAVYYISTSAIPGPMNQVIIEPDPFGSGRSGNYTITDSAVQYMRYVPNSFSHYNVVWANVHNNYPWASGYTSFYYRGSSDRRIFVIDQNAPQNTPLYLNVKYVSDRYPSGAVDTLYETWTLVFNDTRVLARTDKNHAPYTPPGGYG